MGRWVVAFAGTLLVALGPGAGSALAGQAASFQAIEGTQFSGVVDTVSCPIGAGQPRTPMIDWGDGAAASQGTVASPTPGKCTISGSHTYAEEASYATTVTYSGNAKDTGSATVGDAPLSAGGAGGLSGTAGGSVSGTLATFSDSAPEPASSYTATIDWGDGTTSPGQIGGGTVSGSHTYTYGGSYPITVTVHDEGGGAATANTSAAVGGCPASAPSTPSPSFSPPASGLDARYVEALFHDLLGRPPGGAELSYFLTALSGGASRYQVALSILQSTESRQDLIRALYAAFLDRAPDPSALLFLTSLLQSGATSRALSADVLGSGAFFSGPGGGSNDQFLRALYCITLFRPLDSSGQLYYGAQLASGASRGAVASSLLGSTEYLDRDVETYFLRFLRRPADSTGLMYYVNLLRSGASDEQVVASMVSSPEYYALFNHALNTVVTVSRLGVIHLTLRQPARLTLTVLRVLRVAREAAAVKPVAAPRTRRLGVVSFAVKRRGRVALHWDRRVSGKRLRPGAYVLVLRAYHGRRLILTSDALRFTMH